MVGTTARASKEGVRALGYSIYYTMVNIGSTLGPFLAGWVHSRMRVENVFRLAALSVFLMFIVTFLFFRDPVKPGEAVPVYLQRGGGRNEYVVLSVPEPKR